MDAAGIHAGELQSSVVVLPAIAMLTDRALKVLDSLVAAGGKVNKCVVELMLYP